MSSYQITAIGDYQFYIILQPMMGNTEGKKEFGPFNTREELMAFYNAEKVEPYSEEGPNMFGDGPKQYRKSFRKGGPLEWMNPLMESEFEAPGWHGHGIYEVISNVRNIVKGTQVA